MSTEITEPSENTNPEVNTVEKEATPNTRKHAPVTLKGAIVNDELLPKSNSIYITNYSPAELDRLGNMVMDKISSKQEERKNRHEMGDSAGLYLYDTQEDDGEGGNVQLYVTEDEFTILMSLQRSFSTVNTDTRIRDFLEGEAIENQPSVTRDNQLAHIAIMSPQAEHIKNPAKKISTKLGLGIERSIPAWHSGFRVDIRSPSAMECLNLETSILKEKIDASFETYGYSLTSANVQIHRVLIDFALRQVTRSTGESIDPDWLKRNIALTDFDTLLLGLASVMFPEGYNLERSIIKEGANREMEHISRKSRINPWRMLGVKTSKFTHDQLVQMSRINSKFESANLKEYRNSISSDVSRMVELNDEFLVKLRIPTLDDYLRIGLSWNVTMQETVNRVLRDDNDSAERRNFLYRASNIARLMFSSHWIEGIYERHPGEEPTPIEGMVRLDPEKYTAEQVTATDNRINELLNDMSVDTDILTKVLEGIDEFVSKVRLTAAIMPREANTPVQKGEHPSIIVVDPVEIFFTLLRHKIQRAGG